MEPTSDPPSDQPSGKHEFHFLIEQRAETLGWPIHGIITEHDADGDLRSVTGPLFSLETARRLLGLYVKDGVLTSDEAASLEASARSAKLPEPEHRFDMLFQIRGQSSEKVTATINRLVHGRNRSPARLEELHVNRSYPKHAGVFLESAFDQQTPYVVFSTGGLDELSKRLVRCGLVTPDDAKSIRDQALAMELFVSDTPTRADLVMLSSDISRNSKPTALAIALGLIEAAKPPRFEACGDGESRHLHFNAINDVRFGSIMFGADVATAYLDGAIKNGVIAENERPRLMAELAELNLPATSELDRVAPQIPQSLLAILDAFLPGFGEDGE